MREHPGAYDGFHFSCDGIYEYENIRIQCYHKTAHGEEDFAASFANSCNGAFASLGLELDLDGLKGLSEQLLFNRDQPLSIPYKQSVSPDGSGCGGLGDHADGHGPGKHIDDAHAQSDGSWQPLPTTGS